MHGWLFKDINVVKLKTLVMLADHLLKLNHSVNTCSVFSYYFILSLSYKYLHLGHK